MNLSPISRVSTPPRTIPSSPESSWVDEALTANEVASSSLSGFSVSPRRHLFFCASRLKENAIVGLLRSRELGIDRPTLVNKVFLDEMKKEFLHEVKEKAIAWQNIHILLKVIEIEFKLGEAKKALETVEHIKRFCSIGTPEVGNSSEDDFENSVGLITNFDGNDLSIDEFDDENFSEEDGYIAYPIYNPNPDLIFRFVELMISYGYVDQTFKLDLDEFFSMQLSKENLLELIQLLARGGHFQKAEQLAMMSSIQFPQCYWRCLEAIAVEQAKKGLNHLARETIRRVSSQEYQKQMLDAVLFALASEGRCDEAMRLIDRMDSSRDPTLEAVAVNRARQHSLKQALSTLQMIKNPYHVLRALFAIATFENYENNQQLLDQLLKIINREKSAYHSYLGLNYMPNLQNVLCALLIFSKPLIKESALEYKQTLLDKIYKYIERHVMVCATKLHFPTVIDIIRLDERKQEKNKVLDLLILHRLRNHFRDREGFLMLAEVEDRETVKNALLAKIQKEKSYRSYLALAKFEKDLSKKEEYLNLAIEKVRTFRNRSVYWSMLKHIFSVEPSRSMRSLLLKEGIDCNPSIEDFPIILDLLFDLS